MEDVSNFKDRLHSTLVWWLGKKKAFNINGEYEIRLLFIDKINNSAKIEITNLKSNTKSLMEVGDDL